MSSSKVKHVISVGNDVEDSSAEGSESEDTSGDGSESEGSSEEEEPPRQQQKSKSASGDNAKETTRPPAPTRTQHPSSVKAANVDDSLKGESRTGKPEVPQARQIAERAAGESRVAPDERQLNDSHPKSHGVAQGPRNIAAVAPMPRKRSIGGADDLRLVSAVSVMSYCNAVHIVDKRHVLCGCGDSTVRLYKLDNGALYTIYSGNSDRVLCVAAGTKALRKLTVTAFNETVRNKAKDWTNELDLDPEDMIVFAGSRDETVCAWSMLSGRLIFRVLAHEGAVWGVQYIPYYAPSPELTGSALVPVMNCVVSCGADGFLKSWNLSNGELLHTFRGSAGRVSDLDVFYDVNCPFEYKLVSGGIDRKVHVWDLKTGQHVNRMEGHTDEIMAVSIVKTNNSNHYNVTSKLSSKVRDSGIFAIAAAPGVLGRHENVVAVSGGRDRSVIVWDIGQVKPIYLFKGHSNVVTAVSGFVDHAHNLIILSVSDDRTLKYWSMSTGRMVKSVKKHGSCVRALSTLYINANSTSSGVVIVTGGWDKYIRTYKETGEIIGQACCIM